MLNVLKKVFGKKVESVSFDEIDVCFTSEEELNLAVNQAVSKRINMALELKEHKAREARMNEAFAKARKIIDSNN